MISVATHRYAGYPSEVAVGCTLYHVAADEPTELRCSWGGPANRVGGNTPADGEWVPVVAAVEQSVGEALHASAPAEGEELPTQTTLALVAEKPIEDVTISARWGDSACSFVVDLEGDGAHYALPRDIALANADKEERELENPDQLLAVGARGLTQLCPLRLAGSGATVRRVRVLMRARSFWAVTYISEANTVEVGTIEWAARPVVTVEPVETAQQLQALYATVGWY